MSLGKLLFIFFCYSFRYFSGLQGTHSSPKIYKLFTEKNPISFVKELNPVVGLLESQEDGLYLLKHTTYNIQHILVEIRV